MLITDEVSAGLTPEAAVAAAHNEYLVDDVLKFAALPAFGRVRGRSGRWLSLHASPLSGGPHPASVAVTMNPAPATDVAEVLLLAYGLAPRERDVLARVVAGLPSRAIATELHITVATVQDHLKSVFAKTGVRSRSALVATILGL
ncbi:hypothetical protein Z951_27110 [Streptomyces sp. PRh5]|uniref:helix-turn-helix transcriptional regulator n=1 Tax=Streptomyces sp. PRh5 TaxID=1158056 RepID=UPI0004515ACE|nr:helix-turn-helix transcriptional regulator [Streptomyces sp. PRh5]EXU65126.1 hypothetical protein Z951_27110 [Streptomyces sp. PRh5]